MELDLLVVPFLPASFLGLVGAAALCWLLSLAALAPRLLNRSVWWVPVSLLCWGAALQCCVASFHHFDPWDLSHGVLSTVLGALLVLMPPVYCILAWEAFMSRQLPGRRRAGAV